MNARVPKSVVQETFTLPSLGKLYGTDYPSEVSIRSMTTFEEKMRLGGQGFWKIMCQILDSVITSPEKFQSQYTTIFDFYFLMYKMRLVSYGHIYKVNVTCPNCGHQTVCSVDLDNLKVNYLGDDDTEPFKIGPLPRSGDTLECRYLRVIDQINNEKRAKEIKRTTPNYDGDPTYVLSKSARIVSINGEEVTPIEAEMYVEAMQAMDSAYFDQAYNKIVNKVGMDMSCTDFCEECGEELVFDLPFNSEFFRPTFDL